MGYHMLARLVGKKQAHGLFVFYAIGEGVPGPRRNLGIGKLSRSPRRPYHGENLEKIVFSQCWGLPQQNFPGKAPRIVITNSNCNHSARIALQSISGWSVVKRACNSRFSTDSPVLVVKRHLITVCTFSWINSSKLSLASERICYV